MGDYDDKHWICPAFFGDEQPRFIFRFATGKELFGSQPGVFQSMRGGKRSIKDVYVLNEMLDIQTQSELKVFTEADVEDNSNNNDNNNNNDATKKVGSFIGKDGKIYATKAKAAGEASSVRPFLAF